MSRLRFERGTSRTYVHCFDNLLSSSHSSAVSRSLTITTRMTSAEHGAPSTEVSSLYQYWEQTPRDLYITKSFRNLSVSGRSLACSSGSTDVMNSLSLHNSHLKSLYTLRGPRFCASRFQCSDNSIQRIHEGCTNPGRLRRAPCGYTVWSFIWHFGA